VDTPKGARYDVEEVRKWREANVKPRAPARERPTPAKLADGALARADDPFILAMMSGDADALTINRAAMQMASRRVALGAVSGTLGANDLDGLKKTLQELRAAEAGYIELEKSKAKLVDEATVLEIVGACCARLVRCVTVLENSMATEVNLWTADPAFRDAPTEERTRIVREFVKRTCRAVRQLEAAEVRKMVAELRAGGDGEQEDEV